MSEKQKNIHKGHRQRLKRRFVKEGLGSFEDHEALELLLFYSIPRRDTNELAHRLISSFGSLKNLFAANVSDIMQVEGVGEHTAILIKLLPEIAGRYWFSQHPNRATITSILSAAEFFQSLLFGESVEKFYIACLDVSFRVISEQLLSQGTPTQTPVFIRHIAEAALRNSSEMILVAHNHPGGDPYPSKSDIELTIKIQEAMDALSIRLLDHIIVSDHDYFSFAAKQLVQSDVSEKDAYSAKYSTYLQNTVINKYER